MKFYLLPIAFFYLSTVTAQPIPPHLMLWDSLARENPDTALAEMQRTCADCFSYSKSLTADQVTQLYIGSKALFVLKQQKEAKELSEYGLKQKDISPWVKGKLFANIGAYHQYVPNWDEAAHFFTEAEKQFKAANDTLEFHKASVMATSAAWRVYSKPDPRYHESYSSAFDWLKSKPQHKRFTVLCAINFAHYLYDIEKSDRAFQMYSYALENIDFVGPRDRFVALLNMGIQADMLNELQSAATYYEKAAEYCCESLRDSCNLTVNRGVLAMKQHNLQFAKARLIEAEVLLVTNTENRDLLQTTWQTLAEVHEKLNEPAKALIYYKKAASLSDTLKGLARNEKLIEIQTAYDTEKLQNQILQHRAESQRNKWLMALAGLFTIGTAVFAMNRRKIAVISAKNAAISAENAAISAEKRVEAEAFAALLAENNSVLLTENAALVQAVALANDKNASRGVIDDKEAVPAPGAILDQYLQIKDRNHTRIRLGDIIYAEILDRRLHFHLVQGKTVQAWITMRDARDQYLPSEHFVQIHRSFIINRNYISHITNESVFMRNNTDGLVIGDEFRANLSD
jgi:DNA-binding LytR/AlgR family response regulator